MIMIAIFGISSLSPSSLANMERRGANGCGGGGGAGSGVLF